LRITDELLFFAYFTEAPLIVSDEATRAMLGLFHLVVQSTTLRLGTGRQTGSREHGSQSINQSTRMSLPMPGGAHQEALID
jgi:hypothetical protein